MKLITLNLWGGEQFDRLTGFLNEYKNGIDIFCFQEVYSGSEKTSFTKDKRLNLLEDLAGILGGYDFYFHPSVNDQYGLTTFVHEDLNIESYSDVFVRGRRGEGTDVGGKKGHTRNMQYSEMSSEDDYFRVNNLHGMWHKSGKDDVPERIEQSKKITKHLKKYDKPQIICGDFNIRPDTKSMEIIESAGFRNLVTESGVTDTRTSFYDKDERFADYILASSGITVNHFQVLPDEVSDHAPLLLDFSI
jgi:endonuclease/exonuclease/phosphatase family metal-dependent hydrolase